MYSVKSRYYNYYKYQDKNAYGTMTLPTEPSGKVKMAISITSQNIQDNINYKGATYIGLTHSLLDDKTVIQYGEARLKVLYVNPEGRFKQVFMAEL